MHILYLWSCCNLCNLLPLLLRTVSQSLWLDHITKGCNFLRDFRNVWFHFFWHFSCRVVLFPLFKILSEQRFFSSVFCVVLLIKQIDIMQYGKTHKGTRSVTYLNLKNILAEIWVWMYLVWGCVTTRSL